MKKQVITSFLFKRYGVTLSRELNLPIAFFQRKFAWSSQFRCWEILATKSFWHVFFNERFTYIDSALPFLLRIKCLYQCFSSFCCRRTNIINTVMTAADSINIYINVHNYQKKNNKNIKHNRPSVDHLDIPMIKFSHELNEWLMSILYFRFAR